MLAQFEKELTERKIKHCNNNLTKRTRWYWCSIKKPKIEHQRTWDLLTLKLSFSRKELYPPVEDIDFFPGFPVKFTVTLLEYFFFLHWPPWKSMFFSQFLVYPWNSNDFYSTPWNFPLISSTGGYNFILEKPIVIDYLFKVFIKKGP